MTPIPRQLRTLFIGVLAPTLLFLGMLQLVSWRKNRGGVGWTWIIWVFLSAPYVGEIFTANRVRRSGSLSEILTLKLAAILPENWFALIVLAAVLLGWLYLGLERQFKKMDLIADARPAELAE